MDQSRCGDEADSQTLLTGCQPKAESDMRLAGPAVSHGDDVLVAGDVITARQLHYQHLVQRGHGLEVEAVETFGGGELRSLDPPFHHTPFPVDELQFGEAQKVAGMIDTFCRALFGDFVILAQESRQTQSSSGGGPATVGACRS